MKKRIVKELPVTKSDRIFLPLATVFVILGYFSLTIIGNSQEIAVLKQKAVSEKEYLKRIEGEVKELRKNFTKLNEILLSK